MGAVYQIYAHVTSANQLGRSHFRRIFFLTSEGQIHFYSHLILVTGLLCVLHFLPVKYIRFSFTLLDPLLVCCSLDQHAGLKKLCYAQGTHGTLV